jgi:hypothetical protein
MVYSVYPRGTSGWWCCKLCRWRLSLGGHTGQTAVEACVVEQRVAVTLLLLRAHTWSASATTRFWSQCVWC